MQKDQEETETFEIIQKPAIDDQFLTEDENCAFFESTFLTIRIAIQCGRIPLFSEDQVSSLQWNNWYYCKKKNRNKDDRMRLPADLQLSKLHFSLFHWWVSGHNSFLSQVPEGSWETKILAMLRNISEQYYYSFSQQYGT